MAESLKNSDAADEDRWDRFAFAFLRSTKNGYFLSSGNAMKISGIIEKEKAGRKEIYRKNGRHEIIGRMFR